MFAVAWPVLLGHSRSGKLQPDAEYYVQAWSGRGGPDDCDHGYLSMSSDCRRVHPTLARDPRREERWSLLPSGVAGLFYLRSSVRAHCPQQHLSSNSDCHEHHVDLFSPAGVNQLWNLTAVSEFDEYVIEMKGGEQGRHGCSRKYLSSTLDCESGKVLLAHLPHRWRLMKVDDDDGIAREYYEAQRPLFEKAARQFAVHPYFHQLAEVYTPRFARSRREDVIRTVDYEQVVTARLSAMETLLRTAQLDGYRVEKDKCEMYRFLRRNRVPVVPILGEWDNLLHFKLQLGKLENNKSSVFDSVNAPRWPLFLKCCHLTQASMQSVRVLKSREWLLEDGHIHELMEWAKDKFNQRADDRWRSSEWRKSGNALTEGLKPGFILQAPANLDTLKSNGESAACELKVDVVWGRAYIAALIINNRFPQITWALRGTSEDAVYEYDPQDKSRSFHTAMEWGSSRWIFDQGHMPCVWTLAEQVAQAIGADQVRVDIFVSPGQPSGCVVNEISLSSGNPLGAHDRYVAQIWLLPLLDRLYKVQSLVDVPVYDQHDHSLAPRKHPF